MPTRSCSRRPPRIRRKPIDPDVARNGKIFNIWTLNLKNGELKQFSDAVGGNLYATVAHHDGNATAEDRRGSPTTRVSTSLHTLERPQPVE